MKRPKQFLTRMVIFLLLVVALCIGLILPLWDAFQANPFLNGTIAAVLLIGIVFTFRQVTQLRPEIDWIEAFKKRESMGSVTGSPKLLAPMAAMLGDTEGSMRLSALSTRSLLDGIASRLDEGREMSRYMIGLLIFLGLLGTFWGLLGTIGAIGDTIKSLSVGNADLNLMFDDLKRGLEAPLGGMATAFSSSLFGLAGSVILGFLDLQAGQAQNRFYNDLEDWLSSETKLSRGSSIVAEEGTGLPAYVTALLEQSAESLEKLERVLSRSEQSRGEVNQAVSSLAEGLSRLTDQMARQQELMERMDDPEEQEHLRNLDIHIRRLVDETASGNQELADTIRSEFKLLARTLAATQGE